MGNGKRSRWGDWGIGDRGCANDCEDPTRYLVNADAADAVES